MHQFWANQNKDHKNEWSNFPVLILFLLLKSSFWFLSLLASSIILKGTSSSSFTFCFLSIEILALVQFWCGFFKLLKLPVPSLVVLAGTWVARSSSWSSSKQVTEFAGLVIRTGLTRTQKTCQHWSCHTHMNHAKHHRTTTFIMKGSDWQLRLSSDLIISPGQV